MTPGSTTSDARAAALVVAVGVSCALHIGKLPVAIPALQDALGLSLLQAGFLLSLVQLAGMSVGILVGGVADRVGPRRMMLSGLLLLALASVWGGSVQSVSALMGSRALEGLGFLFAVLPAPGLIRRCVSNPLLLSRALGWWGAYMPLGTALALLVGASLIAQTSWRLLWWGLAGLSLGAAVLVWRAVPAAVDVGRGVSGRWLGPVRRTLSAPGPWRLAMAFLVYSGQWLAVVGFLPTLLTESGAVAGLQVGVLSALAAGVNVLGNVAAGRWLSRGAHPRTVLRVGYGVMVLSAVVAFEAVRWPILQYLAILLFSAVGGLVPGTLFAMSVRMAPGADTVSATVGWMQQCSSLGQFLGPPLVAWVATQVGGWHLTWVVTGAAGLVGWWLAQHMTRHH